VVASEVYGVDGGVMQVRVHHARTPSSFSLIHQPVKFVSLSHEWARSNLGAMAVSFVALVGKAQPPTSGPDGGRIADHGLYDNDVAHSASISVS
jgi:hypothetical protein